MTERVEWGRRRPVSAMRAASSWMTTCEAAAGKITPTSLFCTWDNSFYQSKISIKMFNIDKTLYTC